MVVVVVVVVWGQFVGGRGRGVVVGEIDWVGGLVVVGTVKEGGAGVVTPLGFKFEPKHTSFLDALFRVQRSRKDSRE